MIYKVVAALYTHGFNKICKKNKFWFLNSDQVTKAFVSGWLFLRIVFILLWSCCWLLKMYFTQDKLICVIFVFGESKQNPLLAARTYAVSFSLKEDTPKKFPSKNCWLLASVQKNPCSSYQDVLCIMMKNQVHKGFPNN